MDTGEKRKQAAEKWEVQTPRDPIFPPPFMGVWRDIYQSIPPELQLDAVRIDSTSRQQYAITIVCSQALKEWLDDGENRDGVMAMFKQKISPHYQLTCLVRKS